MKQRHARTLLLVLAFAWGCSPAGTPKRAGGAGSFPAKSPSGPATTATADPSTAADPATTLAAPAASSAAATSRLTNAAPTPRDLAEKVLEAIRSRDVEVLESIRITEGEYKTRIWPEFPQASSPKNTIPAGFHWGLLDLKSRQGAAKAIRAFGGTDFELLELVETRPAREYATFRLVDYELRVRRRQDGEEGLLRFLGSLVVMDDGCKLLSYRD